MAIKVIFLIISMAFCLDSYKQKTIKELYHLYLSKEIDYPKMDGISNALSEKTVELASRCKKSEIADHIQFIYQSRGSAEEQLSHDLVPLFEKCDKIFISEIKRQKTKILRVIHSSLEFGVENKIYQCRSTECLKLKRRMRKLTKDLGLKPMQQEP